MTKKAEMSLANLNKSAEYGTAYKSIKTCEKMFSICPYTGQQLDKLIAANKA